MTSRTAVSDRINEQVIDIEDLRRRFAPVLWVGDFNCSLVGSTRAGSCERRRLLLAALTKLDLTVWNIDSGHAIEGLRTIDPLCGPKQWRLRMFDRIPPVSEGITMSDHAGYWVEVDLPS